MAELEQGVGAWVQAVQEMEAVACDESSKDPWGKRNGISATCLIKRDGSDEGIKS